MFTIYLQAACHCFHSKEQKELLRAAHLGRSFVQNYDPKAFTHACHQLRLLNNMTSEPHVGMPLTWTQLQNLTTSHLIDRLINRRLYPLALSVCRAAGRGGTIEGFSATDRVAHVMTHWASYKVRAAADDTRAEDQVAEDIASRVEQAGAMGCGAGAVSFGYLASLAIEAKRQKLAELLLAYETRVSAQVPLLLRMKRYESALTCATASGDPEVIRMVLAHLRHDLQSADFWLILRKQPTAMALHLDTCRPEELQQVLDQEDRIAERAALRLRDALTTESAKEVEAHLEAAAQLYRSGRLEFAAAETLEQVKLLQQQHRLEKLFGGESYVGQSLHKTMRVLLRNGHTKETEQLRKEFKVPDKRYWWLSVQVLSETARWAELEKLSRSKKSPIGYAAFVEACAAAGAFEEADRFLSRVEADRRARCLFLLGRCQEAVAAAVAQRSEDDLKYLVVKFQLEERRWRTEDASRSAQFRQLLQSGNAALAQLR